MESFDWTIQKNSLVVADEQSSALTRLRENVLYPVMNSALVEPYNAVASTTNALTERLHCGDLLPYKKDFGSTEAKFLSTSWLARSVSGGLGMLIPYTLSGKAAGHFLKDVGVHLNANAATMGFLENEASGQILGAAVYDGMRKPEEGQTRLGNAAGGVAAFSTFAIGHELSKNMSVRNMVAMRTLAGAVGATAQHMVLSYSDKGEMPDIDELAKTSVNGIIMSIVLPESQRLFKAPVARNMKESFGAAVPIDRLTKGEPPPVFSKPELFSEIPLRAEGHEASYDFFVKTDAANNNSGQERGKDDRTNSPVQNRELHTAAIGQQLAPNIAKGQEQQSSHPDSS